MWPDYCRKVAHSALTRSVSTAAGAVSASQVRARRQAGPCRPGKWGFGTPRPCRCLRCKRYADLPLAPDLTFVVGGIELQSRGEPVVPLGKPLETLPKAVGWLDVSKSPKLCRYFAMIRRLEQVSPRHPALHENVRSASSYRTSTNVLVAANSRSQGCVRREPVVRVVGQEPRRQ